MTPVELAENFRGGLEALQRTPEIRRQLIDMTRALSKEPLQEALVIIGGAIEIAIRHRALPNEKWGT